MNFQQFFSKHCSKSLAHPLQQLYKLSMKTGEIPIDLKRAIITPIYKGGSRNLPQNYRPVALTSHLIKILEKILAKNIQQFLETHQKMNPKQHGFRSGRSCLSQLLEHHNKILEELEKSNNVDIICLDNIRGVLRPLIFLIHISDINYEIAFSTVSCFASLNFCDMEKNRK